MSKNELARIIWETSRADESTISYLGANNVAAAVVNYLEEQGDLEESGGKTMKVQINVWVNECCAPERIAELATQFEESSVSDAELEFVTNYTSKPNHVETCPNYKERKEVKK